MAQSVQRRFYGLGLEGIPRDGYSLIVLSVSRTTNDGEFDGQKVYLLESAARSLAAALQFFYGSALRLQATGVTGRLDELRHPDGWTLLAGTDNDGRLVFALEVTDNRDSSTKRLLLDDGYAAYLACNLGDLLRATHGHRVTKKGRGTPSADSVASETDAAPLPF